MALMTAHAFNAKNAYGNSGHTIGSDRDIEVRVFQTAVAKLKPFAGPDFSLSADAATVLSENLRLWDILVIDLVNKDNPLSPALASEILSLSRFVRAHTHGLYGGTGTVDILIDINKAILKGLLGQPGNGATATQAA